MKIEPKILALNSVGDFITAFLNTDEAYYDANQEVFSKILRTATQENPWFTHDALITNLTYWANCLKTDILQEWVSKYPPILKMKNVGLILAGNIPLVGFHDVLSCILSGHHSLIKLSSKDKVILPFLLKLWQDFAGEVSLNYSFVERLESYDAVIATGSNNTAQYFEFYFKNTPNLIRKNRTSVAILTGNESTEDLQNLAKDIFTYYGLGCRNVSHLFLPKEMKLDVLFENFISFSDCINHHKYANNYDYNKAIYLLNQEVFWDNNFVMMKENESLFSPLSVLHFTRYEDVSEVKSVLKSQENHIQCCVASQEIVENGVTFGETQNPSLTTYADQMDTMAFLRSF